MCLFSDCLIARTRSCKNTKLTRLPLSSTSHPIGRLSPIISPWNHACRRVHGETLRVVPLDCTACISVFNASNLLVIHQRVSAAAEARDTGTDKVCLHLHCICTRNVFDKGDSTGSDLHCFAPGPRSHARESNIRISRYLDLIIDWFIRIDLVLNEICVTER